MMPFGGIISLLVLLLLIGLGVMLLRSAMGRKDVARSPALDALAERYAKGEISREEYLQKKRDMDL